MAATSKAALFPRELLEQSSQARRDYFRAYTVAHPTLAAVDQQVSNALREPGGALLIFVVGPTGVGKSTFLDHLEQRLIEQMLPLLELDPGRLPVVKLQAKAPAAREFRWANFYTRGLLAVQEPLLNYKVNPHAVSALHEGMRRKPMTNTLAADVDLLQLAWEQAIAQRRPAAILIDEAQHMGKTGRGSKLLEHLDHLKCLAITTQTVHVLVGTYQLLAFRNLSAQLCRRSIDVHFPRYQATNKQDVYAFKNVLLAFQRHLPVEEMPDFVSQWQTCYAYTAGCVGLLKEWVLRALSEAVETGEKTVSPALLLQHAPSAKRCDQMITEIEEGEGHFHHDEGAEDRLRSRLGLEPRRKSTVPKAEQQQQETGQRLPQSSGNAVGQRLAKRDPLKGGAEICEELHN
jgi:hypothetical protein